MGNNKNSARVDAREKACRLSGPSAVGESGGSSVPDLLLINAIRVLLPLFLMPPKGKGGNQRTPGRREKGNRSVGLIHLILNSQSTTCFCLPPPEFLSSGPTPYLPPPSRHNSAHQSRSRTCRMGRSGCTSFFRSWPWL